MAEKPEDELEKELRAAGQTAEAAKEQAADAVADEKKQEQLEAEAKEKAETLVEKAEEQASVLSADDEDDDDEEAAATQINEEKNLAAQSEEAAAEAGKSSKLGKALSKGADFLRESLDLNEKPEQEGKKEEDVSQKQGSQTDQLAEVGAEAVKAAGMLLKAVGSKVVEAVKAQRAPSKEMLQASSNMHEELNAGDKGFNPRPSPGGAAKNDEDDKLDKQEQQSQTHTASMHMTPRG